MTAPCRSCGLLHSITDTDPGCRYECHPECGPDIGEQDRVASCRMSSCSETMSSREQDGPRPSVDALMQRAVPEVLASQESA